MGETPAELPFIGDHVVCLSHDQAAHSGPRKEARASKIADRGVDTPRTSPLRAAAPGSFADANSTIRSNASGAVDAVGASNMSAGWWWLADYRSAIGSSAPRPIDAIDASRGFDAKCRVWPLLRPSMRVVGGREHTQTDNDNNP